MIENTPSERIADIVARQRSFFSSHQTLSVDYRLRMLRRLREGILRHEEARCEHRNCANMRKIPK